MALQAVEESDEDDLLAFLDAASRRENNRAAAERYRARKKRRTSDGIEPAESPSVKFLQPVNEDEKDHCMDLLRAALGAEGLDECTCAVCDRLVLRREVERMDGSDWKYMDTLREVLGEAGSDIPPSLLEQYEAPLLIPSLENVLVSPRGIECYLDEEGYPGTWVSVCKECSTSIRRRKLPKFAIANGFFMGALPDYLKGLTIPERMLTQLSSIAATTRVMRGGRHRCIRSHCLAFDCTPGPPVSLLPRSLADVTSYRVVMVGDFTEGQIRKVRKMHRIRNGVVRDVVRFYKMYNKLYDDVVVSDDVLGAEYSDDTIHDHFVEHTTDDNGDLDDIMDTEQQNVRGHSDAWRVICENDEESVVERRIGLTEDTPPPPVSRDLSPVAEVEGAPAAERVFLVRRSDHISNDTTGDLFAKLFPHLFPFGRGHPGEYRRAPVSVKACMKYYLELSGRQFAEDELFTLVAFDRISLQNMFIHNSVRCKRFPRVYDGHETIDSEQLGNALLTNERRRQGCLPRTGAIDPVVKSFLKTVEISTSSIWGSNAERSQCRRKAFACQARFGQPALFVTLTPNSDNAFVIAQYTGVSSVQTLFDILDARMPTKAELREASLGNDCASARLFMRQVDAFIKCVLGIHPRTRKPTGHRGLFGTVEAYFGMVETQGRGALHIHFLIWLKECPPNSAAVEKLLQSAERDQFRASVAAFAHSIVSNELPIDLAKHFCSECGASYSSLVALPIPDAAHKDPQAGMHSVQLKKTVKEPELLQCNICKSKFSSQHALRSALLQSRPLHWPPWKDTLSTVEIVKQANNELSCRDTRQKAFDVILEREKMLDSLSADSDLKNESGLSPAETAYFLELANDLRMGFCKSDDDPFQNDYLTRLIEMLPPSNSDSRMAKKSIDYMVSVLVILLNQHWWCHTSSCFKRSRATGNANMCRYSFPRERVDCTRFGSAGVETKRTLGHEFINGFNYTIMATFKCNHDIQVLLGGREATDRIYYCCKYVTKYQNRLDSVVPVALSALKRRKQRELQEMGAVCDEQERLATARKRVASMAYALTNRQEVAGPLAALYLYRGSCCYASTGFATLPVGDVVRQLCASNEYTCSVVNEGDSEDAASFRVVSFLDDYIYRPDALLKLNLYEFVMRYYRQKGTSTSTIKMGFSSKHPLHQSHRLACRYEEVVPIVQGFRLPYLDDKSSPKIKSKYATLSLVLFKPFRSLEDIIGARDNSEEAWLNAFSMWEGTCSEFVRTIMNNMNDYQQANMQNNQTVNANASEDNDTMESDNEDVDALFDKDDNFDEDDCRLDTDEDFSDLWGIDESKIVETMNLNPSICPTSAVPDGRIAHILDAFSKFHMLRGAAVETITRSSSRTLVEDIPPLDYMREWIADAATDNAITAPVQSARNEQDTTAIELLDDALGEPSMSWTPSPVDDTRPPTPLKQCASIADISRAFTLNEKQHYAVKRIGMALLTRWRNTESLLYMDEEIETRLRSDQLQMFLGGEGGTGKSRVIGAIEALCGSWGRASSIVKTALTGKAATIIGGRTLASFLLQLQRETSIEAVMNLDIIVIDEVSMMKKSQLTQLDTVLRNSKRIPNVAFGGIHVVLVGDFLQLPPVGADPIYRDPMKKAKCTANDIAGYQLWSGFQDVIVLDESVRFRLDPEWGHGCHEARRGIWTPEFVSIINSRAISRAGSLADWLSNEQATKFVTPDNSTRLAINNLFISTAAKALPSDEYPVRVVANFKGKLAALSAAEVKMVMSLPDSKFGRMPPYLDLIIGMPVQVTQNIRPQKMVANGTLGVLEAIIYEPGTTFRLVHDSAADMVVKIPSVPPPAVLVRIQRGDMAARMQGSDDAELFPLFFASQAYGQCHIALMGHSKGLPRELAVRIQQFPLVCAVSSTVYKIQGETLDRMVVTEWRSSNAITNKRQQPYLLVSRVTSRSAFVTLTPISPEIIKWAHPPADALEEEDRLLSLSNLTIQKLMNI